MPRPGCLEWISMCMLSSGWSDSRIQLGSMHFGAAFRGTIAAADAESGSRSATVAWPGACRCAGRTARHASASCRHRTWRATKVSVAEFGSPRRLPAGKPPTGLSVHDAGARTARGRRGHVGHRFGIGRIERSTLTFSSRSASASSAGGGSIATTVSSCIRWFCSMSRSAPAPVVVAGAAADADVLGHGDLHMVDEIAVPQRFDQRVGEAEHQQVLDGFLAQIVIDAEDLLFVEMRGAAAR